jgi:imidazolonepropionase-like amidohydrolase
LNKQLVVGALSACLLIIFAASQAIPILSPTPTPRASSATQVVPDEALVIKNGTVIDGTGAPPIQDGIVVVIQNKIAAVGAAADFAIPTGTRIVDARGGTILPGIINSHVHETTSALVRRFYFLDRGVTTTCDLSTPLAAMARAKEEGGSKLTARNFIAGPIINRPLGYPGTEEFLYTVTNPEEARRAVTDLVNHGADMIKIALEPWNWKLPWLTAERETIPNLDLAELQAIVAQAHAHGKLVRLHLGTAEMLDLALAAKVDTIEHVPLPRLTEIDFLADFKSNDYAQLAPEYESQLARIVKQQIVMVPTLDKIITWCDGYAITDERKTLCRKYALSPVRRFYQMGGKIALGDDSGFEARTWMPIREMQRLLAIGLTPMEVLQASTARAAQVCGHGAELGTLEPGKFADIIVVPSNPLIDLTILNRVSIVIIDGKIAVTK